MNGHKTTPNKLNIFSYYFPWTYFSHQNFNMGDYKIEILLESESFTAISWLENVCLSGSFP